MADQDLPVVRLVSLTKVFGNARGISLVDLEVHASQVFGFLGPNGAGKSTTIRLMMGLYLPTAGRAQLFGLDAHPQGPDVRRRVGYLPGELALYPRLTGTRDARPDRPDAWRRRPRLPLRPGGALRCRAGPARAHPVQGQPAEDRPDRGVHARPGTARARRTNLRPGPATAEGVRRASGGVGRAGSDCVPVVPRPGRGAAAGPPGGDHP